MECRVLIKNSDLQSFEWCKYDVANDQIIDSGNASRNDLKKSCSGCQRIILFLPQQDIFLTTHQFPQKAHKAQLNAIAYSIEDAIGQDIEDCFCSVGTEQPDHSIPIAVIARERMDAYAEFFNAYLSNVSFVLPSIYLCPWSDDEALLASVCEVSAGYLIRYGEHAGFFCTRAALEQSLMLLKTNRSEEANRIDLYTENLLPDFQIKGIVTNSCGETNLLEQKIALQQVINLKQKEYQSSYQLLELLKNWYWPFAVTSLLLIAVFCIQFFEFNHKQDQLEKLQTMQVALIDRYLPDTKADTNPKKQLVKALSDAQMGLNKAGFVDLLHEYINLKSSFNALKTNRIQFQQSKLMVNLESKDLGSMEAFRDKLSQSSFPATIEDVSINPDKTTGRLIMQGS